MLFGSVKGKSAQRGTSVRKPSVRPSLTVLAALIAVLSPAVASAQEEEASVRARPRPEYDPLGKRFGGFDLNASVQLGVESTDNLFATETLQQDDVILSARPQATLSSHWNRHALVIAAGADLNSHQDFSSEDATSHFVSAYGRLDVGSDTQVSGTLRAAHEVEPRTDPDSIETGEPVEFDRTDASASVQHTFNRLRLRGTVSSVDYDYESQPSQPFDQDLRDRTEQAISGRAEVAISPRLALVGQVTSDTREYDDPTVSATLDSEGTTFLAGVSLDLTNLISGEVTVGQFEREYENGETVDGVALDANVEWYITRLTTLTFQGRRAAEESGATVVSPFVETVVSGRVDHELLRNLILSAEIGTADRNYEVIDREDEAMYGTLEAEYLVNRRISLEARYVYEDNTSTGADRFRDFEVNRFFAGVTFRL